MTSIGLAIKRQRELDMAHSTYIECSPARVARYMAVRQPACNHGSGCKRCWDKWHAVQTNTQRFISTAGYAVITREEEIAWEPSGDRMFNLFAIYRTKRAALDACRTGKGQHVIPVKVQRWT